MSLGGALYRENNQLSIMALSLSHPTCSSKTPTSSVSTFSLCSSWTLVITPLLAARGCTNQSRSCWLKRATPPLATQGLVFEWPFPDMCGESSNPPIQPRSLSHENKSSRGFPANPKPNISWVSGGPKTKSSRGFLADPKPNHLVGFWRTQNQIISWVFRLTQNQNSQQNLKLNGHCLLYAPWIRQGHYIPELVSMMLVSLKNLLSKAVGTNHKMNSKFPKELRDVESMKWMFTQSSS